MADGCYYDEDADAIQKIFTQNFLDHYTGDKTPFPLFFHSAWFFNRPHRQEGFFKFIDSILALPDVYFVTSQELVSSTILSNFPYHSVDNSGYFYYSDFTRNQLWGSNKCRFCHFWSSEFCTFGKF